MRMPKVPEPNEHPARKAARLSRTYFAQRKKKEWLDLWAENGVIKDPIGKSLFDPSGEGFSTPESREQWWDDHCDQSFFYAMVASFAAGNQVANYETLVMVGREQEGVKRSFKVEGIWTYEVDEDGKLLAMLGYWEEDAAIESETPLPDHHYYVE